MTAGLQIECPLASPRSWRSWLEKWLGEFGNVAPWGLLGFLNLGFRRFCIPIWLGDLASLQTRGPSGILFVTLIPTESTAICLFARLAYTRTLLAWWNHFYHVVRDVESQM